MGAGSHGIEGDEIGDLMVKKGLEFNLQNPFRYAA
jgi:hypothetical protein